jgi:hypothetical protein
MIESFLIRRVKQVSAFTANKDLHLLRAVFNYAMHPTRNWIVSNPTRGIQFFRWTGASSMFRPGKMCFVGRWGRPCFVALFPL